MNNIRCPRCNSLNINEEVELKKKKIGFFTYIIYIIMGMTLIFLPLVLLLVFLSQFDFYEKYYLKCCDCGKKFTYTSYIIKKLLLILIVSALCIYLLFYIFKLF